MQRMAVALAVSAAILTGCAADAPEQAQPVTLGPVDGRELPPTDLDRIQTGDDAPDFSLVSLAGPVVTLSEYRGSRNVILVFYRGWW